MALKLPFDLGDVVLGKSMSLVVVDREYDDFEVKIAGPAANYLASAWQGTLDELESRELVAYSPDVVIRAGENRALVIKEDLRTENEVIETLLEDSSRPSVRPKAIETDLYLYAVVATTKAGRVAMIKKKNPAKRASSGKELFGAGDELVRLEQDPWELDPLFDLVVNKNGGYALNTWFFEQLFADADRLRAKIGPWVDAIAKQLPMDTDARDRLVSLCDESPRLRRRLRSIAHRGHIDRVKLVDVRRHVRDMGLTAGDFVKSNKLVVDESNAAELLRVLNEDLTRGGLTQDRFRIEGKEPLA
jgi:hypothetical protein